MSEQFRYTRADSRFRCLGCSMQMIAPIYVCPSGHDICEDCKYTYPCKVCNMAIGSLRNYTLESLTFTVLYTCRWHRKCGAFSCRTIRAHESACPHRIYMCPAPYCGFDGYFTEMPVHIDLKHSYYQFYPMATYKRSLKQDHTWYMMAYYEIFICKFTLDRYSADWSMHLQAPYSRGRDLVCELEVGGRRYPLKLVNYFGPKYEIELPYDVIPEADEFFFIIRVTRANNFIV